MNKPEAALEEVRTRLRQHASPERSAGARRFFTGDQVWAGYGVSSTEQHAIARDLYRQVKHWPIADRDRLCVLLWEDGTAEGGSIACDLYRRFAAHCGPREFRMFTGWLDHYVHNWAHTDGLSAWLMGACVQNYPELASKLPPWTRSRNRWKRRAAAVSLIYSAKRGEQTGMILQIAEALLGDPDDMVQKGIGWLLKEAYPAKPAPVMRFLLPRRDRTTRLVLRYAAEKMSPSDRARLLSRTKP